MTFGESGKTWSRKALVQDGLCVLVYQGFFGRQSNPDFFTVQFASSQIHLIEFTVAKWAEGRPQIVN